MKVTPEIQKEAAKLLAQYRSGQITATYAKVMLIALGCKFHPEEQHKWVSDYFESGFKTYTESNGVDRYLISETSSGSMLRFFDDADDDDEGIIPTPNQQHNFNLLAKQIKTAQYFKTNIVRDVLEFCLDCKLITINQKEELQDIVKQPNINTMVEIPIVALNNIYENTGGGEAYTEEVRKLLEETKDAGNSSLPRESQIFETTLVIEVYDYPPECTVKEWLMNTIGGRLYLGHDGINATVTIKEFHTK